MASSSFSSPRRVISGLARRAAARRRELTDHDIAVAAMSRFVRNDIPSELQRQPLALLTSSLSREAALNASGRRWARQRLVELVGAWPAGSTSTSDLVAPELTAGAPVILAALPATPVNGVLDALAGVGIEAVGPPDALSVALHSFDFEMDWHVPTYAEWLHDADFAPLYRWTHSWAATLLPRRSRALLVGPDHLERVADIGRALPSAVIVMIESSLGEATARAVDAVCARRERHSDAVSRDKVARYLTFRLSTMVDRADRASPNQRILRFSEAEARADPHRVAAALGNGDASCG